MFSEEFIASIPDEIVKGRVQDASDQFERLLLNLPPKFKAPVLAARDAFCPTSLPTNIVESSTSNYIFEIICDRFGFQYDSVANQFECVVTTLASYISRHKEAALPKASLSEGFDAGAQGSSTMIAQLTVSTYRSEILENYDLWLRNHRLTSPSKHWLGFDDRHQHERFSIEIALWHCMWAEAANLRFAPEFLCYVYYHLLEAFPSSRAEGSTGNWTFLKNVVTPNYKCLIHDTGKRGDIRPVFARKDHWKLKHFLRTRRHDHPTVRNYDDFNEFFWYDECMEEHIKDVVMNFNGVVPPEIGEGSIYHEKSFYEVRSYGLVMRSFYRHVYLHVLGMHGMIILADIMAFDKPLFPHNWRNFAQLGLTASCVSAFLELLEICVGSEYRAAFAWRCKRTCISGLNRCTVVALLILRFGAKLLTVLALTSISINYTRLQNITLFGYAYLIFITLLEVLQSCGLHSCLALLPGDCMRWCGRSINVLMGQGSFNVFTLSSKRKVSWSSVVEYSLFWVIVIVVKFLVDYFLLVKRGVKLTELVAANYTFYNNLVTEDLGDDETMQLFGGSDISSQVYIRFVVPLWITIFSVYIIDLEVTYNLASNILSAIKAVQRGVGSRLSVEEVATDFHTVLPAKLEKGLMSNIPQLASMRSWAKLWNDIIQSMAEEDILSHEHLMQLSYTIVPWMDRDAAQQLGQDQREDLSTVEIPFEVLSDGVLLPPFAVTGRLNKLLKHIQDMGRKLRAQLARKSGQKSDMRLNDKHDPLRVWNISQFDEFDLSTEKIRLSASAGGDIQIDLIKFQNTYVENKRSALGSHAPALQDISAMIIWIVCNIKESPCAPYFDQRIRNSFVYIASACSHFYSKHRFYSAKKVADAKPLHVFAGLFSQLVWLLSLPRVIKAAGRCFRILEIANQVERNEEALAAAGELHSALLELLGPCKQDEDVKMKNIRPMKSRITSIFSSGEDPVAIEWKGILSRMREFYIDLVHTPPDQQYLGMVQEYKVTEMARQRSADMMESLNGSLRPHKVRTTSISPEAWRRITFLLSSFDTVDISDFPPTNEIRAFGTLTPYYSEEVIFPLEHLFEKLQGAHITQLQYLETIYPGEWQNFISRMEHELSDQFVKDAIDHWQLQADKFRHDQDLPNGLFDEIPDGKDEDSWLKLKFELRLWASYRAQTLARTTRGMMYNDEAIRLTAILEEEDSNAFKGGDWSLAHNYTMEQLNAISRIKYNYIISAQIFGRMKRAEPNSPNADKAEDIKLLLFRYPNLRVAYVDEQLENDPETSRVQKVFYSVLIRFDRDQNDLVECYRVRLPGEPIRVGEAKPNNQNHALPFLKGCAIQAIDMNQDCSLEDALKMRVMQEFFEKSDSGIVGYREHVFTKSISSPAEFMSQQESVFVTSTQRILDEPLNVRFHYGHPDFFNKTVVMTRGGMAKASKGINLSEDIFSGFNYTLRGKNSTQSDFVQVGKGKDVGFTQISLFNAKISMGNAEQVISRDLNRLAQQFSFLRSFSLYYTCVGAFLGQVLVIISIWCVVYAKTFIAVTGTYELMDESDPVLHRIFLILTDAYVVQVYFLQFITMILTFIAERGMWRGLTELADMVLRGSIIFYAFQVGTKAYYLNTVMMYGGATYKATGRGFVLKHERFKDSFQHYFYSHYLPGLELLILLIIEGSFFSSKALVIQNVPFGLVAASWLYCPALFNPQGLDYESLRDDMDDWLEWIYSRDTTDQSCSWEKWWQTQVEPMQHASFNTRVLTFIVKCRYIFVAYMFIGAATQYRKKTVGLVDTAIGLYVLVGTLVLGGALFAVLSPSERNRDKFGDLRERRKQRAYFITVLFIVITAVLCVPVLTFTSLFEVLLATALVVFFLADGVCLSITGSRLAKGHDFTLFNVIRRANQAFHLIVGFAILAPLIVISWIPFLGMLQGRVLFNDKFAERLRIALDENKKKLASLHDDTYHSIVDEEEGGDLSRVTRKHLITRPTVMNRMKDGPISNKKTRVPRRRRSEAVSSTSRSMRNSIPSMLANREERLFSRAAPTNASDISNDTVRSSSAAAAAAAATAEIAHPQAGAESGEVFFGSGESTTVPEALGIPAIDNPMHSKRWPDLGASPGLGQAPGGV